MLTLHIFFPHLCEGACEVSWELRIHVGVSGKPKERFVPGRLVAGI